MSNDLRAAVVIDYQNIHLVGADLFPAARLWARHESLVDPILFAQQLLLVRNARQRPGYASAVLRRVLVYRGLPLAENDPAGNRRNMAQQVHWERDPRVSVTLRPLKYLYERDAAGRPVSDVQGKKIVVDQREKGIDVLCALAVMREARAADIDLVILASTDSDLEPALEEAHQLKQAKIETCSWYHGLNPGGLRGFELRPVSRIWNTRLDEQDFLKVRDRTEYRWRSDRSGHKLEIHTMTADAGSLPPFHLAIPVHDIQAARHFYGEVLGFGRGRSDERWTDWDVAGHQVVTHQVDNYSRAGVAGTNLVDGHEVPVPHFGLVLSVDSFQGLAQRLVEADVSFIIEPYVRFEGEPGEQWTMFFLDPTGNALEFKAFRDIAQLFAT